MLQNIYLKFKIETYKFVVLVFAVETLDLARFGIMLSVNVVIIFNLLLKLLLLKQYV